MKYVGASLQEAVVLSSREDTHPTYSGAESTAARYAQLGAVVLLTTTAVIPLLSLGQNLEAAGLACLVPSLDVWKGSTVAGPLPGVDGGRTMEIYLQRWPADKKVSATLSRSVCHTFVRFYRASPSWWRHVTLQGVACALCVPSGEMVSEISVDGSAGIVCVYAAEYLVDARKSSLLFNMDVEFYLSVSKGIDPLDDLLMVFSLPFSA